MNIPKRNMHSDLPYWEPVKLDGKLAIRLACPNGHRGFLNHEIDRLGRVSPSIECPEGECGFHEGGATLDDYNLGRIIMEARPG